MYLLTTIEIIAYLLAFECEVILSVLTSIYIPGIVKLENEVFVIIYSPSC